MLTQNEQKGATFFVCDVCDYTTGNKYNIVRHEMTLKHKMLIDANENEQKRAKTSKNISHHICSHCLKKYKHKSSLCRHQLKCKKKQVDNLKMIEYGKNVDKESFMLIDKEKLELIQCNLKLKDDIIKKQNEIIDLTKDSSNTTINNNLNINVYLNEHCKNAMNLTEFMNKMKLSLEDLFYTKNNGYIDGVSNIFIKHLKELEPTNRPIHCSNKRGIQMYIKDDDKWEKDYDGKLDSQINHITQKHINVLKEWEITHPNWETSEQETQIYMELIQKIMGGSNDEERKKNIKQIKKNIGKNIILNDIDLK
jgi:hypothetical protein